jgi:hypothetical protein
MYFLKPDAKCIFLSPKENLSSPASWTLPTPAALAFIAFDVFQNRAKEAIASLGGRAIGSVKRPLAAFPLAQHGFGKFCSATLLHSSRTSLLQCRHRACKG